jgi:hypothetical protein
MANKDYFFQDDHNAFRETLRRFVEKEITPKVDAW